MLFLGFLGSGRRLALLGLPLLLLLLLGLLALGFGFLSFLGARSGLAFFGFVGLFLGFLGFALGLGPLFLLLAILLVQAGTGGRAGGYDLAGIDPDISGFGGQMVLRVGFDGRLAGGAGRGTHGRGRIFLGGGVRRRGSAFAADGWSHQRAFTHLRSALWFAGTERRRGETILT